MAGGSRTAPPSPADWSFCPVLADMIRQRRVVGESGRVFDGLGALSTPNNLAVLRSLMLERRPQRTLEVGLSYGGSALAIAASHRDLGHAPARQHVALDPFQATDWDNCCSTIAPSITSPGSSASCAPTGASGRARSTLGRIAATAPPCVTSWHGG